MVKNAREAIKEFQDRLISKDRDKIEAIILYGSILSNKYKPQDSDIDIMIISSDRNIDEDILDAETAVSLKYGVVISALLAKRQELQNAQLAGYSFPNEVLKGEVIYERYKRRNKISF